MRKRGKPQAHLVNLGLNEGLNLRRQLEETRVKPLVINLLSRVQGPTLGRRVRE